MPIDYSGLDWKYIYYWYVNGKDVLSFDKIVRYSQRLWKHRAMRLRNCKSRHSCYAADGYYGSVHQASSRA